MTRVLIIDNYDSFVYNLYQYVGELGAQATVLRNNITLNEIEELDPDKIIISPGPGRPEDAGISVPTVREYSGRVPILGVCLGHQAIGYAFGAEIVRARSLFHGKTSLIEHDKAGLFQDMDNPFIATRYHSLVIEEDTLPADLMVTARAKGGSTIMAVGHRKHPTFGVQFHPESILTAHGKRLIKNFLDI